MTTHLFIPDTQCKPNAPTDHLEWAGQYIVDIKPDRIVHAGDHWDLPSMSSYDRGKTSVRFNGRQWDADILAGDVGLGLLDRPLQDHNRRMRHTKHAQYLPTKDMTGGNHEARADTYVETHAEMEGTVGTHVFEELCNDHGYTWHPFLQPLWYEGVGYAHYWYNPLSGRVIGGGIDNRLNKLKHSFSMGHTQTLMWGRHYISGRAICGLVAGSFYLHDEDYKGPQGNEHWRGLVVKHEVHDGAYDPMFVSMNYLCNRYEGMPLEKFMRKVWQVPR